MSTSPELDRLLAWLYALERRGLKKGLRHTERLLAVCGNPQRAWAAIHVAGTNGKGSTCAMLASIAREAGRTVGLYTSPHLVRFNERIQVNGIPIDDESIMDFILRFQGTIDEIRATFFEATTALAFWYFRQKKVDLAIVETGLGGRLDSTNVLTPRLTVITPIGWDHKEILGSTLTAIAREKGGILKPGIPVILGPQAPHIARLLKKSARDRGSPCHPVDLRHRRFQAPKRSGFHFRWKGNDLEIKLVGRHQVDNACVAWTAMETFAPELPARTLAAGVVKTVWPGRMEPVKQDPPVYYDVAHNASGLKRALETLELLFPQQPRGLMVLKGDKDLDRLAQAIRGKFHRLMVSGSREAGLLSAEELSAGLRARGIDHERVDHLPDALTALNRIQGPRPGLVFGSHYIADAVYSVFGPDRVRPDGQ